MQNPLGFQMSGDGGRAELIDFGAVLTNPVALATFPHTIFGAYMYSAGVVVAVSAWHVARGQHLDTMRSALRYGLWFLLISAGGTFLSGDQVAIQMVQAQPMKMAAAEALYNTACGANASFSIFSIGTPDGSEEVFSLRVPYLLAFLSEHDINACVQGINDLQALYTDQFGPGDYAPTIWITYWAFRWMMGLGIASAMIALAGLWLTRKSAKRPVPQWGWKVATWVWPLPILANLVGWTFTEMGRQPWIVFGLMLTEDGVSPSVPGWSVLISLITFTALYLALAVVEVGLIVKAAKAGPDTESEEPSTAIEDTRTTVY